MRSAIEVTPEIMKHHLRVSHIVRLNSSGICDYRGSSKKYIEESIAYKTSSGFKYPQWKTGIKWIFDYDPERRLIVYWKHEIISGGPISVERYNELVSHCGLLDTEEYYKQQQELQDDYEFLVEEIEHITPICPLCGNAMTVKKGPHYKPFWGCDRYKPCKGRRQVRNTYPPPALLKSYHQVKIDIENRPYVIYLAPPESSIEENIILKQIRARRLSLGWLRKPPLQLAPCSLESFAAMFWM